MYDWHSRIKIEFCDFLIIFADMDQSISNRYEKLEGKQEIRPIPQGNSE